jgi:hypothetical protein
MICNYKPKVLEIYLKMFQSQIWIRKNKYLNSIDLAQSIFNLDTNASLSGNPAYKIDYSYVINTQEGPIKIKNLQVWTISGDNAYILTFGMESSKYSDYAPLIDDIINSFKLVQSQTAALNT